MAEDNENQTPPEDDQPESSEDSTSPEGESNDESSESSEVSAEDIVGDDADMTPEEAETLAAAMAAINQVKGVEPAAAPEPEMTDDEAATLAAAMSAINQVQGIADSAVPSTNTPTPQGQPFESPIFSNEDSDTPKEGMDLLSDVHMDVRIELGRTKMYVEDVLKLGDGAVVELDKLAGDPVDVFVNNRKVAKGEVLVLNDMFCVRISEIVDISSAEV